MDSHTTPVVGLPYHWGPSGVVTGGVVNDLVAIMLDPNVRIHEAKALTCNLRKGRKLTDQPPREQGLPRASTEQGGAVGRTHSEGAEMLEGAPFTHT